MLPLLAAAVYLVVLSAIPRKSLRCAPVALGLLSAVFAVGLYAGPLGLLARIHRRLLVSGRVGLAETLDPGEFVMVPRTPLTPDQLGGRKAELLGVFTNVPDLSARRRVYVYRIDGD